VKNLLVTEQVFSLLLGFLLMTSEENKQRNVLVFVHPTLSAAGQNVRQQLILRLSAHPLIEHLEVVLPRAELMLRPRLVGLWDALVFIGGSTGSDMPTDEDVCLGGEELFRQDPKVVLGCHPADLWPGWQSLQAYLYRQGADRRWVDVEAAHATQSLLDQLD
jgi:hypothetical protein